MCSINPVQIREEVSLLLEDMYLRLKRSLFAGVSTAFLSIFLPCVFVPYKTSSGVPQKVLVDEAWESELCIVVALTAFSLYITYLMPLNYLDLLHRSAVHLGAWDQIEGPKIGQTGQANWAPMPWVAQCLYSDGETVQLPDGRCFRALIVTQFWMLVLTTDWQHIVTIVLLMFANYLLLAKLFKDKESSRFFIVNTLFTLRITDRYHSEPQTLGEEREEVPRGNLRMEGVPPVSWIARPVRVQLVPGGSDQSVEGNLYTVDPVTGSLVLVRFRSEKPWQVSWIPREGYASVTMLEESSPHCQQYSVELADMMGNMFGMQQVNQVDDDELKERRERLLSWLRSNHVDVKECADGSLFFSA
ncbi:hypothetical protein GCK32_009559, partial [Trichostrongylus colubriformis]